MGVTIPIIALGISAASTGYGVYQGREQAREGQDASRDQENQQLAMQQEFQQQQAQQDTRAQEQQAQAVNRQRILASGFQNASQTQFTSPLGLPGGAATARPSLLGL